MKRILVCEDESAIRDFVVIHLKRAGYEVLEAASGEEAVALYEAATEKIDMALLDVMLPGIDGFEVCRKLRERDRLMGIIMLTARTQEREKVSGLQQGADDYVTKPFSPSELMARIESLNRRVEAAYSNQQVNYLEQVESGSFVLNLRSRTLYKDGAPLDLTQVEYQIMEYFFANEGETLSRTDILTRVWGSEYYGEEKVVDVNIRRLRMKVEDDPSTPHHIVTVWGMGYKWLS